MMRRTDNSLSIVGFHRSVMGLGEDARTLAATGLRLGFSVELIDVSPAVLEPTRDLGRLRALEVPTPTSETVIFCLPPGEMRRAYDVLGLGPTFVRRRRIGYWPWESSELPVAFDEAFELVDELWASSTFLLNLYRTCGRCPVYHVPLTVTVEAPVLTSDVLAFLDGRYTMLSIFDFHSQIARKNPLGAITAFLRAFPLGTENVQMVLKTINGGRRPDDLATLLASTFKDPRIVVVDGPMDRSALCGLIAASDVYLSLHRAEGFGRPIAEAMLLGTPVVATQWSGTADFLDETTGFPVPSVLRPVRVDEYPFAAGLWAEPDIDYASERLSTLFHNAILRREKTDKATEKIIKLCGEKAAERTLARALNGPEDT